MKNHYNNSNELKFKIKFYFIKIKIIIETIR